MHPITFLSVNSSTYLFNQILYFLGFFSNCLFTLPNSFNWALLDLGPTPGWCGCVDAEVQCDTLWSSKPGLQHKKMHLFPRHQGNAPAQRRWCASSFQTSVWHQAWAFFRSAPSLSCSPGCTNWLTGSKNGTTKNQVLQFLLLSWCPNFIPCRTLLREMLPCYFMWKNCLSLTYLKLAMILVYCWVG